MRRKIIRTFVAAALISVFCTVSAYAESAVVTANGVNFRAGPGTNYYVIATLDRGTPVEVLDRSNGSWVAVSCGGYNGFISSSYLSINQSSNLNILPDYSYDYGYGSGSSNGIVVLPEYSGSTATQPDAPAVSTPGSSQTAGYINAMYVRFRSGPY